MASWVQQALHYVMEIQCTMIYMSCNCSCAGSKRMSQALPAPCDFISCVPCCSTICGVQQALRQTLKFYSNENGCDMSLMAPPMRDSHAQLALAASHWVLCLPAASSAAPDRRLTA